MNLEGHEALEVRIFLIGISEVGAQLAIQKSLQVVPLALDHDGIPVVPFEEAVALLGEGFL